MTPESIADKEGYGTAFGMADNREVWLEPGQSSRRGHYVGSN